MQRPHARTDARALRAGYAATARTDARALWAGYAATARTDARALWAAYAATARTHRCKSIAGWLCSDRTHRCKSIVGWLCCDRTHRCKSTSLPVVEDLEAHHVCGAEAVVGHAEASRRCCAGKQSCNCTPPHHHQISFEAGRWCWHQHQANCENRVLRVETGRSVRLQERCTREQSPSLGTIEEVARCIRTYVQLKATRSLQAVASFLPGAHVKFEAGSSRPLCPLN
jgi:hypothetical protein